jgi:XTP/dITP diphosphohydrolase
MTEPYEPAEGVVVLASGNAGKLRELQDALAPTGLRLKTQSEFDVPEAVEDGSTFIENAIKKARNASRFTGLPALADDSGLVVPALNGAPGVHSARYSDGGDSANNEKLLAAMSEFEGDARAAWFVCVLVLLSSATDPSPLIAEAKWHGKIAMEPKGSCGFGYDPLFLVDGLDGLTAANLDVAQKRKVSHRGLAVSVLREKLGC